MVRQSMRESPREQAVAWQIRLQQAPHNLYLRWRFKQWLDADSAHDQAWQEIEQLWQLSAPLAPARRRYASRVLRPVAAAAVLIMALASTSYWPTHKPLERGELQADNSLVWSRPDSQLRIQINDQQRHVELIEGAAYFDVSHDQRPFIVQSGPVMVRVLGTAFSVKRSSEAVEVCVERGEVSVNGQSLRAQQRGRVSLETPYQVSLSKCLAVAPWRENSLLAINEPLAELLKQVDAVYPGSIFLLDSTLGQSRISGRFDLNDPEQALHEMLRSLKADMQYYWPGVLLISRSEK